MVVVVEEPTARLGQTPQPKTLSCQMPTVVLRQHQQQHKQQAQPQPQQHQARQPLAVAAVAMPPVVAAAVAWEVELAVELAPGPMHHNRQGAWQPVRLLSLLPWRG